MGLLDEKVAIVTGAGRAPAAAHPAAEPPAAFTHPRAVEASTCAGQRFAEKSAPITSRLVLLWRYTREEVVHTQ